MQQQPVVQPGQQQQQQQTMGTPRATAVATPFSGISLLPGADAAQPSRVVTSAPVSPAAAACGSEYGARTLGKPPSFTGRSTAAIFSHHAEQQQQQQQQPQQEVCTDVTSSVFATHMASGALQPPALLNPADTFNFLPGRGQEQQPQLRTRQSALRAASLQRRLLQPQQQQQLMPPQLQSQMQQQPGADLGVYGMQPQPGDTMQPGPGQQLQVQQQLQQQLPQLPQQLGGVLGGLLGMGQQQQDTLDGLLGQVNQELMREAGTRQYAALQFGTLDTLGTPTASAAAAAAAVAGFSFGPTSMAGGMHQWRQQGGLAAGGFGAAPVPGWLDGGLGQFGGMGQQQQQQAMMQGMQGAGAAADSNQEVVR
jgi:hypothetical protein